MYKVINYSIVLIMVLFTITRLETTQISNSRGLLHITH